MNQNTKTILIILLALLFFMGILAFLDKKSTEISSSTKYDDFSMCLAEKGAKFYGAFWCPHCQAQKKMFENSQKLPYVECSTPDTKGQTDICKEQKVESYPTWIFANGERISGEISLETLAEKTGCELPVETK